MSILRQKKKKNRSHRVSKKDARFSKFKNIFDIFSDDREGKIIENIDCQYFSDRASLWETL